MKFKLSIYLLTLFILTACNNDYTPKPKGFLHLHYPEASYKTLLLPNTNVQFEVNSLAKNISFTTIPSKTKSIGCNVNYPSLKATLFLTYKAVENTPENLNAFINDAQKLTLEHTKKADEIPAYPFEDANRRVFGLLSEVKGNVASPVQFYITDSTQHFLTGSLYFNTKPNYDSILPAANYIQKDVKHIIESVKWARQ